MDKYWYGKVRTIIVGVSGVSAGSETEVPIFCAPFRCKIKKVSIVPKTTISGANTNYMTLGVKNKGTDGSGTDVIASTSFTNGVNASAFAEKSLGAVSHNILTDGTVVSFYKSEAGSGMGMPDLIVKLEIARV